jgi:hypothetical protein
METCSLARNGMFESNLLYRFVEYAQLVGINKQICLQDPSKSCSVQLAEITVHIQQVAMNVCDRMGPLTYHIPGVIGVCLWVVHFLLRKN